MTKRRESSLGRARWQITTKTKRATAAGKRRGKVICVVAVAGLKEPCTCRQPAPSIVTLTFTSLPLHKHSHRISWSWISCDYCISLASHQRRDFYTRLVSLVVFGQTRTLNTYFWYLDDYNITPTVKIMSCDNAIYKYSITNDLENNYTVVVVVICTTKP